MKIARTGLAAAALAAAATVSTIPPASAAPAPVAVSAADTDLNFPKGAASVAYGTVDLASKIYRAISSAIETNANRSGLVQAFQNGAWYEAGESKNVLVMKADHPYDADFQGVELDATYSVDGYPKFRVVVFESGTVTNNGDGGYINWAFRGWFDRDGMTVNFHQP
ncbi:hypothetical protein ACHAAC_09260 [Aeromicrobium sp. CF4.19]|uniref:hypothetical protein n=1 Tax=Aeromicrobium sp. CF4.19 TaxID=3373082 RepID=UPI003EE48859